MRVHKDAIKGECSFYSIKLRFRVVGLTIEKQCSIPFYQKYRQSLKKMSHTFCFLSAFCLAVVAPSVLICSSASTCNPPRVSAGMGMKAKPALLQASPKAVIFLVKA